MKYYLISDVHGEYDKMIDALAKAGFDETQDTLVMVGDAIDRGQDSENVIDYLLSLSNKILLWGNHEARFLNLLNGASIESYDFHNCTTDTIAQLGAKGKKMGIDYYGYYRQALESLRNKNSPERAKMMSYFSQCHMAVEFTHEIATHAWLPGKSWNSTVVLDKNWRKIKSWNRWYDALWTSTDCAIGVQEAYPDKKLIVGHYYAWALAEQEGQSRTNYDEAQGIYTIDTSTYDNVKAAFIDGMSYDKKGCVNVYVIEDNNPPIFYDCASLPKPKK